MTKAEQARKEMREAIGTWIYVWGGKGENLSEMTDEKRKQWIEEHETADNEHTKAQNVQRCEALYQKYADKGVSLIRAGDCSGFVSYFLKKLGIISSRRSSRGLYAACEMSTDKTGMTKKDLQLGDLVFKHNGKDIHHVAMYTGNNRVIEMTGRDIGAKERKLSAKDNRFGRMKGMQDQIPDPDTQPGSAMVRVIGNSVSVRKGPARSFKRLKIAHKGDKFALIGVDPANGWYNIRMNGEMTGWISNRKDLTEVIDNA